MRLALLTKNEMIELYGKEIEIIPKIENTGETAYIEFTEGCPKEMPCLYCNFYRKSKFRRKSKPEIFQHIEKIAGFHKRKEHKIKRVFLGSGDSLTLKSEPKKNTDDIKKLHTELFRKILISFPYYSSKRQTYVWIDDEFYEDTKYEKNPIGISSFVSTRTILDYGTEDLKKLKEEGLKYVYWGIESGSNEVLETINKGCTKSDILKAGQILNKAEIIYTAIVLIGVAGEKLFDKHIKETAKILKRLKPEYISFSFLEIKQDTPYFEKIENGQISNIKKEKMALQKELIKHNLDIMEYIDEEYEI